MLEFLLSAVATLLANKALWDFNLTLSLTEDKMNSVDADDKG